ncbi:MAG: signal peptidase I [Erysipelotrichia bacterium]|nr:signal peptidase I [Erysipelotrichia bacterium]
MKGVIALKKMHKIVSIVLLFLILLSMIIILYLKVSDTKVFTLVSSSMEPSLKEGSLLFNKSRPFSEIETGDIITYKMKNSDVYVTHRVSEIDHINERILCKGDANKDVDDSFITYDQYRGNLWFYISYLGNVVIFMHSTLGKGLGVVLLLVLLISVVHDIYKNKQYKLLKKRK